MLRLICAALLAAFAMPAQAAQFIKYEGGGRGELITIGKSWYTISSAYIEFIAYVPIDGMCPAPVTCAVSGNSVNVSHPIELTSLVLDFDYTLDGFPLSGDGMVFGSASGRTEGYKIWRGWFDTVQVSLVDLDVTPGEFSHLQVIYNTVPEPATWAMMIAGFGLAGGMMRRRARHVPYPAIIAYRRLPGGRSNSYPLMPHDPPMRSKRI